MWVSPWRVKRPKDKGGVATPHSVFTLIAMAESALPRHFTATGFVVNGDATLLHWHHRVQAWLPPGGHVEPDEDPVQAVLREVKEETGLDVELIPTQPFPEISNLDQVTPPRTILIEDVYDHRVGKHQHIDMIYFCRLVGDRPTEPDGWRWFTTQDLQENCPEITPDGNLIPPPEDVQTLGLEAIRTATT